MCKIRYFDDKLRNYNTKKITSNKAKHVLIQNELNKLSGKFKLMSRSYYNFFLDNVYFTSDDGSCMFVYQTTLDKLELK